MAKYISEEKAETTKENTEGKAFIRVSLVGDGSGFIDTPKHAKEIIDEMVENAMEYGHTDESYEFSVVVMSQDEFESLPEFRGF